MAFGSRSGNKGRSNGVGETLSPRHRRESRPLLHPGPINRSESSGQSSTRRSVRASLHLRLHPISTGPADPRGLTSLTVAHLSCSVAVGASPTTRGTSTTRDDEPFLRPGPRSRPFRTGRSTSSTGVTAKRRGTARRCGTGNGFSTLVHHRDKAQL